MCIEQRAQLPLSGLQLALLHLCQPLLHLPHRQHTLPPMAMPKSEPREPQRQRSTAGPGAQHARLRNRLQRSSQDLHALPGRACPSCKSAASVRQYAVSCGWSQQRRACSTASPAAPSARSRAARLRRTSVAAGPAESLEKAGPATEE